MLAVVPHNRVGLAVPCPRLSTGRVQLFQLAQPEGKEEEDVGVPMRVLVTSLWILCLWSGCGIIMVGEPVQELDLSSEDDVEENLKAVRAILADQETRKTPSVAKPSLLRLGWRLRLNPARPATRCFIRLLLRPHRPLSRGISMRQPNFLGLRRLLRGRKFRTVPCRPIPCLRRWRRTIPAPSAVRQTVSEVSGVRAARQSTDEFAACLR